MDQLLVCLLFGVGSVAIAYCVGRKPFRQRIGQKRSAAGRLDLNFSFFSPFREIRSSSWIELELFGLTVPVPAWDFGPLRLASGLGTGRSQPTMELPGDPETDIPLVRIGDNTEFAWSIWEGRKTVAFRKRIGVRNDVHFHYDCVLMHTGSYLPLLHAWKTEDFDPRLLGEEFSTESAEFNNAVRVTTTDQRFASAVMDAQMMSRVLDNSLLVGFAIGGEWLLAVYYETPIETFEVGLHYHLASTKALLEEMPRFVLDWQADGR